MAKPAPRHIGLISFKTGRGGGVALIHPDPGEFWSHLVASGSTLTFVWKRDLINLPGDSEESEREAMSSEPLFSQEILNRCRHSPRLRPDHLLTELPDRQLATRLTRLHLNSHESLTEQGVVTLYVAFGFLRWFEDENSEAEVRSPLLLVPVQLERENVEAPWQLQPEEEEILPNHSLIQLLASQSHLRLPVPEDDAADPDDPGWRTRYFGEVARCVRHHPRWEVLDESALGTFSFQKLAMWEDLGRNQERISDHDLCRAIAGDPATSLRCPADLPRAEELDQKTRPQETYHILDADSSQHAAIAAATRGTSLVLDGPPGTGKSQTIANVIAESLAAGKTVLFVSEKAAALEVVQRRLQDKQLGDFVLACHSHKANKREVVAELGRCLYLEAECYPDPSNDLQRLFEARRQLNEYVRELHGVRSPLGMKLYQVHGELTRLARLESKSRCPVPSILERDTAYLRHATELLASLPDCRAVVEARGRHPWQGCRAAVYSLTLRDDAQYHLGRLAQQLPQVAADATLLHQLGFGAEHPTRSDWLTALANAQRALSASSWWDAARRQELQELIRRWIDCFRTAKKLREELTTRLAGPAFARDSAALVYRTNRFRSFWARLLPGWWSLRGRVRAWYARQLPPKAVFWDDLEKLGRYHQCLESCHQTQDERAGNLLVDDRGKPEWTATLRCLQILDRFEQTGKAKLNTAAVRARLEAAVLRCTKARAEGFDESWEFLTSKLFDPTKEVSTDVVIDQAPLSALQPWLSDRATDAHRIDEWIRYREIERQLAPLGALPVLQEVLAGQVKLTEAADAFQARFLRLWLDAVYERAPVLRQFRTESHERLIERFRELDRRSVALAPARIRNYQLTRPDRPRPLSGKAPGSSELGTLLGEVNKKRRHRPLRRLFAAIPTLLLRLKPCLMMSPLAVSTYLESPDIQFDLVIFDEASQVRPHDAICAIYRGKQLMVAGDQKQLPPTDFFQRVLEEDEETFEEDADSGTVLSDFDSLLDVCCTLGLSRRRLRWHYRSRREGLIAFSNHHIYGNELVTFPSVHDTHDNPAVAFEYIADGRWKAGTGGGFNAVEARRVAELVLAHFREHPDQSLGVIAFSQRHQMRILDELEQLRHSAPDLEDFFHEDRDEPFFVKNLETVQGDERDVIFLSVGYGPDETGRVVMNFGPLNHKEKGERRLNVAVTRARQRMTVVSSLRAQHIDLSRTNAVGVKLLRAYLDYAERGPVALLGAITGVGGHGFDSPFEQEVYEELTRRGLTVHPQVGCSGFRIDLAIVDPRMAGRYLLGVECDGATYHSSATARDRDRLRQEVLESLGWRVCRIWSTEWLRDREGQVQRVQAALEKAHREKDAPVRAAPAAPETRPNPQAPPARTTGPAVATPPLDPPIYGSIEDVPEDVLRDVVLAALRTLGATRAEDLIPFVVRQLGFKRTGRLIQAGIEECLEELARVGQVCRTADQRLQAAQDSPAAST